MEKKIKFTNGRQLDIIDSGGSLRGLGHLSGTINIAMGRFDIYKPKMHYYHHGESECVWRSLEEIDWSKTDGLVDEIDKDNYVRLLTEYKQEDNFEGHYQIFNDKNPSLLEWFKPTFTGDGRKKILTVSGHWGWYLDDIKRMIEKYPTSKKVYVDVGRGYYVKRVDIENIIKTYESNAK